MGADLDAVFIPARLRAKVAEQLVPDQGLYFENCKYVEYGYFGNLEVFSKQAWATLMQNVDNFEISTDGACPGDRPKDQVKNKKWIPPCAGTVTPSIHPFKKPDDWKKCYDETNQRRDYLN